MIVGTFVSWPLAMRYVARLTGLGLGAQLRQEIPALGTTLIMVAALLFIRRPIESYFSPWPAAVTFIVAGASAYLASLAIFGRQELIGLINLMKKIRMTFARGYFLEPNSSVTPW